VLLFNAGRAEAIRFIEKIQKNYSEETLRKYSISSYPEGMENHNNNCAHHLGLANTCNHSMPGLTSLHVHRKNPDRPIALQLQPIFYDDISIWKRLSDIILSTFALIVLSPLLIVTAIAVKFSSKGPIFFRQKRAGLGGKPFTFLKFRTMHVDAEERKCELLQFNERTGPVFKMKNDPRITRLGVHLRRWSIDELPQLINVLVGDMSLVGPRPPSMDEVEKYDNWHKYRLEMKPGITCIWQVYARHEKCFENWVRLDIKYRREQSFLLDMKLLFMTIPAVLSRKGAC
jgi:lipopolysaccharide/colanic/teichoic acid biosynthesis glycosyltransferase